MTSNDRHSTFDSPYRTGRHVPLNARDGLTSIATAGESRADITSPYRDESAHQFTSALDASGNRILPPESNRPYSPGMRSHRARQSAAPDGFEVQSPAGEIPMQSFRDGMPPAPSVSSSWRKIDKWAEENYPELFDQLCEGCTSNDLNDLEHQLDCSLPQDVRESLQIHDGQERGGIPTGIIFSAMLLDCEEIVEEWTNWRKVNEEFLQKPRLLRPPVPSKGPGAGSAQASSSAAASSSSAPTSPRDSDWRQDLLARQDCVPPGSIQKAYAHPAWIPLVRDWGGNCLAVDLAPGPKGHWGQVIMFGRDYDTKYIVARSWAAFLAIVADDLSSGRWFVDEDSGELKLREFKQARVEPAYFDILRWRMDQKYGRTASKRKSMAPGAASRSAPNSPYANPTEPNGEHRGRSMHRPSAISPIPSPIRPGYGKSSPLARVAEESGAASPVLGKTGDKLVEVDTPRQSNEEIKENAPRLTALANGENPADETKHETQPNGSAVTNGQKPAVEVEEAMKTIEI
ncbi:cell wall assembly and cell proliferation coordinating protein [Parathielavia appendiculata]|uniref:Cell wall assembly and cell proliferation coordinating protein n=1 Tax=Parathielavia appendiculata TaxID=2587402 RepID=A0AAN6U7D2_9PEZI|nr:cell wall assembly and cell proliferation coordinating protein [Parathielavia appendiculata]